MWSRFIASVFLGSEPVTSVCTHSGSRSCLDTRMVSYTAPFLRADLAEYNVPDACRGLTHYTSCK